MLLHSAIVVVACVAAFVGSNALCAVLFPMAGWGCWFSHWGHGGCTVQTLPDAIAVKVLLLHMLWLMLHVLWPCMSSCYLHARLLLSLMFPAQLPMSWPLQLLLLLLCISTSLLVMLLLLHCICHIAHLWLQQLPAANASASMISFVVTCASALFTAQI